jgi:DNA polymerase-3 subunit gamma/tau
MSYLVFARKFRPQRFEEVVGQEPITRTLQNAIREKRIAQSFLFSGSRGVGKTSTARILAKALNCEKDIVTEPCGECISCREIAQGTSLDVLEIDGASNRGIDNIRELRENVKFRPASARFKVYIIDEVHMVTQEAFNALLKTLEEPPEHVKFIFATTEIHKVPATILSRCQRFVFRKVPTARIAAKLKEIAEMEKIPCDERALFAMAKAAEGSLRDAESLLDQITSFGKGKISYQEVSEVLGSARDETYLDLLDALIAKDAKQTLSIFAPLGFEGKDMGVFTAALAEIFRALLILKVMEEAPEWIELSPDMLAALEARKAKFTREELLSATHLLQNLIRDIRRSPMPQVHVETALLRLALREDLSTVSEMLARLQDLEEGLEQKGGAASPSSAAAQGNPSPPTVKPARESERVAEAKKKEERTEDPPASFTLEQIEVVWAQVIELVKAKKISCGTCLAEAGPVEVEGDLVVLGFPQEFKFHKENLEKAENRKIVEETIGSVLGAKVRLSLVVTVPEKISVSRAAAESEIVPEIVTSAVKLFDGKIIQKS